jgi:hypothetical protein
MKGGGFTDRKNDAAASGRYIDSMHRLGRIGTIGAILVMLGIPTILGAAFGALPTLGQLVSTVLPLFIVFAPSNFSEVIYYTPILGSSIYLTFITGEILNLKFPAANNAARMLNVEPGTESADVISAIAVSVASFVVMALVIVCVVLVIPLQPVLTLPAVKTVSANILPALFGAIIIPTFSGSIGGGATSRGRLKGIILPAALVLALNLLDRYVLKTGMMGNLQGFLIVAILPIAWFGTKRLYRKGSITVTLPDDQAA